MKVIITEKIHASGLDMLEKADAIAVDAKFGISRDELLGIIEDYDGIIERSRIKLDREFFERAKKLKVICMAGVGLDHIDMEAAEEKGVIINNVPDGSTNAVAELAVCMMLSLSRQVCRAQKLVRDGIWNKHAFPGTELRGKTLGIVALGRIGSRVATLCQAFGMDVIAYDPYVSPSQAKISGVEMVDLACLLRRSDIISVHSPLTDSTYHLISTDEFKLMKEGTLLLNLGRGGIIDEDAAFDALVSGKLRGLGLDVVEVEPPTGNKLLTLDNVVMTPHIGAGTAEAQEYISMTVARKMLEYLRPSA